MDRLPIILFAALVLIAVCATRWKEATKALIYLVIFEGALRKWLVPSLSSELYLLKDVVMTGALIGWLINNPTSQHGHTRKYFAAVGIFTLFGFLQIMNPAMASPLGGVFGLKAYVLWAGYPLLLAATLRTRDEFERYLTQVLMVAVPVCLLAVVQSRMPPDSFLNVYARERAQIDTFGTEGAVRVSGTFPYLAGYANFLIFISVFLLPVVLHSQNRWSKLLSAVLFPLIIGTSFMTGSRWPVFFLGLFLLGYLSTVSFMGMKNIRAVKAMLLPMAAAVLALLLLFQSSLTGWIERAESAGVSGDSFFGRTLGEVAYAFDPAVLSPFGDGIGSTNNAAQTIGDLLGMPVIPSARMVEAEPGRVMAELGILGFVLWYGLRVFLIVSLFATARKLREPFLKSLAIAGGWFLSVGIMAPVPFDTTLGAFYWFTAGLSVVLPQLEKKSRASNTKASRRPAVRLRALPGPVIPRSSRFVPFRQ